MSETVNIRELNDLVASKNDFVNLITRGMDQTIVGQKHLVESLLIALLSNGHVLLEGVPGLAKTLAIKTLAQIIDAKYSRIQFTPDLLPADVLGTMVYSVKNETFQVKKARYSPTLFSPTKLTVPRPKCSRPCLKPCRNVRLQSATRHSRLMSRSLLWRLKTRLNRRAPIRFPRPR